MTCEGRVLRKDDELKSGGVRDGSTVQAVRKMRGGGRNKDRKRKGSAKNERTEHRVDQEEDKVESVTTDSTQPMEERLEQKGGGSEERRKSSDAGMRQGHSDPDDRTKSSVPEDRPGTVSRKRL